MKELKSKLSGIEVSVENFMVIVRFSMEVVEVTQLKGSVQKELAVRLVRTVVVEAPISDNKEKLLWECSEAHTFPSIPSNVMKGSWCPTCHTFYSEELCRTTFEQLFNENFLKLTPKWLRSPDGFPMHLDGYCKKLEIAFEYQGHHHFNLSFYNNFDEEKLAKQKD